MSEAAGDTLIVLTSMPDRAAAMKLARALVEKRLAACVNVLAEASSIYRWQGSIETAQEVPLLIKTRGALYDEVEAAIIGQHPYELPEIVAVPVVRGLPTYLQWVVAETSNSTV
ncbi:MAG: cation tolerance protein CutA [Betaproteobacteria bacterium RIFCSPLOWO2_12_FULL_62_13]|nr:MAG: cation tolerance protein CutA [Betaproteobacteria bacterium RIFCSPLOWO2_12_FULL_62_13]